MSYDHGHRHPPPLSLCQPDICSMSTCSCSFLLRRTNWSVRPSDTEMMVAGWRQRANHPRSNRPSSQKSKDDLHTRPSPSPFPRPPQKPFNSSHTFLQTPAHPPRTLLLPLALAGQLLRHASLALSRGEKEEEKRTLAHILELRVSRTKHGPTRPRRQTTASPPTRNKTGAP